jgi:hypothetical protein
MGNLCARFVMCGISLVAGLPALFAGDRFVAAGQSLQQALNEAVPGDTITLQAGITFTGSFVLPNKPGTGWITLQSSMLSALPEGKRVSPAQAGYMAKLMSPNGNAALSAAAGAHNYRIMGLELSSAPGIYSMNTVNLGYGNETSTSQLPYSIVLDRLYIHGDPVAGGKRGISLNSRSLSNRQ